MKNIVDLRDAIFDRLDTKTTWGKEQVKDLVRDCIIQWFLELETQNA